MDEDPSPLHHFHPLIARWFEERYGEPTEIQRLSWPVIERGEHALICAPTGSGKTLTAFLNSLNSLMEGRLSPGGLRILYISPLKALNNDIYRNLLSPLGELEALFEREGEGFPSIRVAVRSGDTDPSERRSLLRNPPEILITTPESLNILLTSKGGRRVFEGLEVVILDEIHAVAHSKRGAHLMTAVERLELLSPGFQRIALSATVRPLKRVAEFVGGYEISPSSVGEPLYLPRPVRILDSSAKKNYRLEVDFPVAAEISGEAPAILKEQGEWPEEHLFGALIRKLKRVIAENRSTLIFTNSRRMAEKLAMLLNEGEERILACSHHGALSREIRTVVERSLKEGELPAVVATSSLELGIDIGDLDQVVLVQSPGLFSTTLQRVGRSGHGVGETSRGLFLPLHGRDLLQAAILAGSLEARPTEEVRPVEGALDLLAQVVLSMVCTEEWEPEELLRFLRTSYPYRNLKQGQLSAVIEMLAGRFASSRIQELRPRIRFDRVENRISAAKGADRLLYMNGGTIPDRGYYALRHYETRSRIGELDEEFVWERSVGDLFTLGNQIWRILEINHSDVLVLPAQSPAALAPFWRAEAQDRDTLVSETLALFLERWDPDLEGETFRRELTERRHLTPAAARHLQEFLLLQKEKTGPELPHRHHLILEHYEDPMNRSDRKMVLLHTLWGGRVNRPFSLSLRGAFDEEYGLSLEAMHDDDCILLLLPPGFETADLFRLVTPENVERRLKRILSTTGFFGAHFRQNAGIAMLLPGKGFSRRTPLWLNRLRSRKILQATASYEEFPVMLETWRSCLSDRFDLTTLGERLMELREGRIRISEAFTHSPSPFARNLIWQSTNDYMYRDDTPGSVPGGKPGEDFFRELARSSGLRPSIPPEVVELYRGRMMRTAPGYEPEDGEALLNLIRERIFISDGEFSFYLKSLDPAALEGKERKALLHGAVRILPGKTSQEAGEGGWVCALENLPAIKFALGEASLTLASLFDETRPLEPSVSRALHRLEEGYLRSRDDEKESRPEPEEVASGLLLSYMRFYGPLREEDLLKTFPISRRLKESMGALLEEGRLVGGNLTRAAESAEGGAAPAFELCDPESLEILLRLTRTHLRPDFEARPASHLQLFLAHHQGLTERGEDGEELKFRMEQLIAYPLKAPLWESEVLPARLYPYYPAWLDALVREFGLFWLGCADQTVTFLMERDLELLKGPAFPSRDPALEESLRRIFPHPKGRYTLFELMDSSGKGPEELTGRLWSLAWAGLIANDSMESLRVAIRNRFRAPSVSQGGRGRGFSRWSGSLSKGGAWRILYGMAERRPDSPVPSGEEQSSDARNGESLTISGGEGEERENRRGLAVLEEEERNRERVQVLLGRYGILFRELLQRELPPFRWSSLLGTLRRMELSGELLGGHFFHGIPSLQFMSPSSFRMLGSGLPLESSFWMNAVDPASLCGIRLEGMAELPARLPGNHLFFIGVEPAIISKRKGRDLEIRLPLHHERLPESLGFLKEFLSRESSPLPRIEVKSINGKEATESEYAELLLSVGFYRSPTGLILRRRYGGGSELS